MFRMSSRSGAWLDPYGWMSMHTSFGSVMPWRFCVLDELLPLGHHTSRTAVAVSVRTTLRDPALVVADQDAADHWSLAELSLVRRCGAESSSRFRRHRTSPAAPTDSRSCPDGSNADVVRTGCRTESPRCPGYDARSLQRTMPHIDAAHLGRPPRPRPPVTGQPIEPDVSRPITTGPGNSGTFPQAISAAWCSAALIFCGTSAAAFKYAARNWYGNCRERRIASASARRPAT